MVSLHGPACRRKNSAASSLPVTTAAANALRPLASATETAEKIKEPYIFLCDAGLMNIAFPLKAGDNSVTGCFFVGPVAMGTGKDSVVRKLIKKFYSRSDMMTKIVSFTYDMQVKTPEEVSYIYDVFCNCILPYIVMENNFGLISGNTGEQSPERKLPETFGILSRHASAGYHKRSQIR